MAVFHGTKHDDNLTGTAGDDVFDMTQRGNETVDGGDGNDVFHFGRFLTATDHIDGGTGDDKVTLNGDYSAGLTFAADTMVNVERLQLFGSHDYNLTMNDGNVAAGERLIVNASDLGAGNHLTFDGSAELDGRFLVYGSAGDDTITGGAKADVFHLENGGNDTAHGGGGNDTFLMGATLNSGDVIDGGAGNDTLELNGDYIGGGYSFGATQLTSVETLKLAVGHSYKLSMNDGNVAAGKTLTVDASAANEALSVDGSAETDGEFHFISGGSAEDFTGGAGNDFFDMTGGGIGIESGNGGNDTFLYAATFGGTSRVDGGTGSDTLELNGAYSSLTLTSARVTNLETVKFLGGHSDTGLTVTGDIAGGSTLTIDASAASNLSIDLSAATSTGYIVTGSAGDDTITGNNTGSTYHLEEGGNDALTGGSGSDTIYMGASLTASDTINGGGSTGDKVVLDGDYSAGLIFGATTMTNVETLQLTAGHSYNLTINSATTSRFFTLDGSALGTSDTLTYDGSAITGGGFGGTIIGGAGDDVLTGSTSPSHGMTFDISHGGNDTVHSHGGDTINAGAALTAADTIDANGGQLVLNGDYSAGLVLSGVTGIGEINVAGGAGCNLTATATTGKSGQALIVQSFVSLTFDGSQVADGIDFFANSVGTMDITGGAGNDSFNTNGVPTCVFHGGGGDDTFGQFSFIGASDSIDGGTGYDTLKLFVFSGSLSDANVTGINNIAVSNGGTLTITGDLTGGEGTLSIGDDVDVVDLTAATSSAYSLTGTFLGNRYIFGSNFTASDTIAAGGGGDVLELNGDYSAGLTLSSSAISGLGTLQLDGSHSYNFTVSGDIAGGTLTVNASALGASDAITLDLSAGTSPGFAITGGAGDDTVKFGGNFAATDTFNGGAGTDTLSLNGDYSGGYTFGAGQLTSVENLVLADGYAYSLGTVDANVAAGATMTIDASALTGSNQLFFSGSNETDGHFAFISGAGADDLTGGTLSDTFDLSISNGAFVSGFDGNDSFTLTTATSLLNDSIDGGNGSDTLVLNGDFSTQTAITFANVANIENLTLEGAANSYNLVLGGGGVEGIGTFTIDASTAAAAAIDLSGAGIKTFAITGSGGDDTFTFGTNISSSDSINGGAGSDTLVLTGGDDIVFGASTLTSIETLEFSGGGFSVNTNDGNVASGATLTVDASALSGAQGLFFNGAAESDGHFVFIGGAGSDHITGGSQGDTITGGLGADTLTGGGGADAFDYTAVSQSASTTHDTITDFAAGTDQIDVTTTITNINAISGTVNTASFDTDLHNLGAAGFETATILTVTGGDLAGHTFLVVDGNGDDVYTGGQDYVIDITGYTGTITTGDFI